MLPEVHMRTQADTLMRRCAQVCRTEIMRIQMMFLTAFEQIPCEHAWHILIADAARVPITSSCSCCYC